MLVSVLGAEERALQRVDGDLVAGIDGLLIHGAILPEPGVEHPCTGPNAPMNAPSAAPYFQLGEPDAAMSAAGPAVRPHRRHCVKVQNYRDVGMRTPA